MKLRLRHCLVAWVIVGIGFVMPAAGKIHDPDIWWHLKTGEWIWAHRSVPTTDPFSFTAFGQPWTAHEWLSEVILYGIFAHFGFIGLILLMSVLLSALMAGIYLLVRTRMDYGPAALLITALCGAATWQSWSPRPQLFTYLLLVGLLLLLMKPQRAALWLAIPMFWLWSNLHGAWIAGFAIMAITLTDASITAFLQGKRREAGRMIAICLLSLAAVMIGPSPVQRLVYPIQYLTGSVLHHILNSYILEYRSSNFQDPTTIPFEILLFALGGLLYLGRRPMRASQWITLALLVHLSLQSGRHIPLLAIIVAPMLATQARAFAERMGKQPQPDSGKNESLAINILVILMLPAMVWMRLPRVNDEAHCVTGKSFPIAASRFLAEHPRVGSGRLLNTYNWGGYLIFHLYPKYLVSIDGRTDVHAWHMRRDLQALEDLSPAWKAHLRKMDPDVILWPANDPLPVVLRTDPDWRVLYQDQKAIVFVRRNYR